MFCSKCGARISDESMFCSECGERIISAPPPVPRQEYIPQQPIQYDNRSAYYQQSQPTIYPPISPKESVFGKTETEINMKKAAFYFQILQSGFPAVIMLFGLIGGNDVMSFLFKFNYSIPDDTARKYFGMGLLFFLIIGFFEVWGCYKRIKARALSYQKIGTLVAGVLINIAMVIAFCIIYTNLFTNVSSISYINVSAGAGLYLLIISQAIFGIMNAVFIYKGGVEEEKADYMEIKKSKTSNISKLLHGNSNSNSLTWICRKCHEENSRNDSFCKSCGEYK